MTRVTINGVSSDVPNSFSGTTGRGLTPGAGQTKKTIRRGKRYLSKLVGAIVAPVSVRRTFVMMIGQSNGISTGVSAANMTADGTTTPADMTAITATNKVKMGYFNGAYQVQNYNPSTGNIGNNLGGDPHWGPEAGFAAAWLAGETHANSLLLISKHVIDSSNLGQFIDGANPEAWSAYYIGQAKSYATAQGFVWDDVILMMVNCETEGVTLAHANLCQSRLTTLIDNCRSAANLGPTMKATISKLPNNPASYPQLTAVRAAQAAVVALSPLNRLIETDNLMPYRDTYHYKSTQIDILGRRHYAAIK